MSSTAPTEPARPASASELAYASVVAAQDALKKADEALSTNYDLYVSYVHLADAHRQLAGTIADNANAIHPPRPRDPQ